MSIKIGINGFGRIGRQVTRILLEKYPEFEIVGINDITSPETNAHLFKYDSTYGRFHGDVFLEGEFMHVGKAKFKVMAMKNPGELPWKNLAADIVLECTGIFTDEEKAKVHLMAGAKKVIISAPAKGGDVFTVVMGVNEDKYDPSKHHILSNASCTTNCLAPFARILHENFSIEHAFMTTIHAYTNDQRILDLPHKDLRRARAAGLNIIPTTTGAAKAVGLVLPELKGKFDGIALRVPTPTVSVVDLVCKVEKNTNKEEVNQKFKEASEGNLKGILGYTELPLVSSDFRGCELSGIIDGASTMVIGGNMVKVIAWYDNEWGYATRLADFVKYMVNKGL
ncbi:MAG TPA: type I glyceraldehyde-3-phosphate dehydrogenase [Candidatus Eremiobacteraeota bacterium]|nr:MAG: Glyceraldehyde-3-phosphate dehydrogenase [bacterium ADurb.Bin363]HPZ08500.1 type I glyceraldehyde-3-phosphate dehydrogenase [Candidatus Eremiobacteraeota bacterium]